MSDLGLAIDPIASPLDYPGRSADGSVVVVDKRLWPVPDPSGEGPAPGAATLDDALARLGAAPMDDRQPVLAIGSNASPAQVRRKFADADVSRVVPMLQAWVTGLAVHHSAHVSRPGYVPATARPDPSAPTRPAVVVWLDPDQVDALDVTEPNYRRMPVPSTVVVDARVGPTPRGLQHHAGRRGMLGRDGVTWPFASQRETIARVVAASPRVRAVAGSTVTAFVAATAASDDRRAAVRAALQGDGLVVPE